MNLYDQDVFEGDIPNGESETLEVETTKARITEVVAVVTDAGGETAPSYDLTIETFPPGVPEFSAVTTRVKENEDLRYHERTALPDRMRYTVTNQSGNVGSYRFLLMAVGNPF